MFVKFVYNLVPLNEYFSSKICFSYPKTPPGSCPEPSGSFSFLDSLLELFHSTAVACYPTNQLSYPLVDKPVEEPKKVYVGTLQGY